MAEHATVDQMRTFFIRSMRVLDLHIKTAESSHLYSDFSTASEFAKVKLD